MKNIQRVEILEKIYKNEVNSSKGITLIALVITILLLIIFAGISVFVLFGENGIIKRGATAREEHKIAELSEKLELVKGNAITEKEKGIITVNEYLEQVQKPNEVNFSIDEIEIIDERNAYITIADGYTFLIEHREDESLIITYMGKNKALKPRIVKVKISDTVNSITAKVKAQRAEKYKFYIKEKIDGQYEFKQENKSGEYTYSNLTSNKAYYLKTEVINQNGQVEREIIRKIGEMPVLNQGELVSTTTPIGWTNASKTTKIEIKTDKDLTGIKLQYAKLPENATTIDYQTADWQDYTNSGIVSEANETIAIRLWNGINETSRMAIKVEKIDKEKPIITETTADTNTITIKAKDEASGIIGYAVTENATKPTSFTSCTNLKNLNVSVGGKIQSKEYYVWVKDEAGNISEYKQIKTATIITAVGNITFSNVSWSGGKASTAISTTSNYMIKYQKNSVSGSWTTISNGETISGLVHGDKIYAKLEDRTGQSSGDYATFEVKDTIAPTATLTKGNVTTDSITVVASVADNESGISGTYKFYIKETGKADSSYVEKQNTSSSTCIATGLNQNTSYTIKVEIKDIAGNVGSKTIEIKTLATYTVTLNRDEGVTSVSGAGTYSPGAKVTISAIVSSDYSWQKWTGEAEVTTQSYTFTMPEKNITFTANTISKYKKYSLKYKSYDWVCPDGDGKRGTMTMQYVNISAENSKYLTSVETLGTEEGSIMASGLVSETYTDVQNVGKSLTATKAGITEHLTNTMTENVTMNFSFPRETAECSAEFSIYGTYEETGGSTQTWSYWHGNSGGGCNVFTINKEQLKNISKIYVDNKEKTFSEDTDFTIYEASVADKRKGLHTYSHTIKIIFK